MNVFPLQKFSIHRWLSSVLQLCVWNTKPWEKQTSKYLTVQAEKETALANTRVQFHNDHARVLVVHETLIGIYKVPELECLVLVCMSISLYLFPCTFYYWVSSLFLNSGQVEDQAIKSQMLHIRVIASPYMLVLMMEPYASLMPATLNVHARSVQLLTTLLGIWGYS